MAVAVTAWAQTPKTPFTAEDAEAGKKLAACRERSRARAWRVEWLFVNRDIFRQLSAARAVEFEAKLSTLHAPPPA